MKRQLRSKWYSVVCGGLSLLVLAASQAQAKQLAQEYQLKPSNFIVAKAGNKQKRILQRFSMETAAQRASLEQKLVNKAKKAGIKIKHQNGKRNYMMYMKYNKKTKTLIGRLVTEHGRGVGDKAATCETFKRCCESTGKWWKQTPAGLCSITWSCYKGVLGATGACNHT